MDKMTMLQKVSEETMRFMRGKYVLDEVGDGKEKLVFCDGEEIILTIYIREDSYDFLVNDGKDLIIPVDNLDTLEIVKQMIIQKKEPNRKPFPKDQAIYSDCGHRCDLCVHYIGETISENFRSELKERCIRVYAGGVGDGGWWGDDIKLCHGCDHGGLDGKHDCDQKKCAPGKGVDKCIDCPEYPCDKATAGVPPKIEPKSILADDVTWVILPYVDGQYGN